MEGRGGLPAVTEGCGGCGGCGGSEGFGGFGGDEAEEAVGIEGTGIEGGCEEGLTEGCEEGREGGCEEGREGGCEDGIEGGCEEGRTGGCVEGGELRSRKLPVFEVDSMDEIVDCELSVPVEGIADVGIGGGRTAFTTSTFVGIVGAAGLLVWRTVVEWSKDIRRSLCDVKSSIIKDTRVWRIGSSSSESLMPLGECADTSAMLYSLSFIS